MSKMNNSEASLGQKKEITLDRRLVYTQEDVETLLGFLGVRIKYWPAEIGQPLSYKDEPVWDRPWNRNRKNCPIDQYSHQDVLRIGVDIALSVLHKFDIDRVKTALEKKFMDSEKKDDA